MHPKQGHPKHGAGVLPAVRHAVAWSESFQRLRTNLVSYTSPAGACICCQEPLCACKHTNAAGLVLPQPTYQVACKSFTLLCIFQQVFLLFCCGVVSAPSMTGVAGNSCCTLAHAGACAIHTCAQEYATPSQPCAQEAVGSHATQHAITAMTPGICR